MPMKIDAEYHRNYRARKKAERMAAMERGQSSLFAPNGSDPKPLKKTPAPKAIKNDRINPTSSEIEELITKLIEKKMGDIIDFPGLAEFRAFEAEMQQKFAEEEKGEVEKLKEEMQSLAKQIKENDKMNQSANEKIEALQSANAKLTEQTQRLEDANKDLQSTNAKIEMQKIDLTNANANSNLDQLTQQLKDLESANKELVEQMQTIGFLNANTNREIANTNAKNETQRESANTNKFSLKSDFLSELFEHLSSLDGKRFAANFPIAAFLGFLTYLACDFVVGQTLPMYKSLSFPNAELASYGAIVLAVGFAGFAAVSRSGVAKLFMAVMIAYELMIVWSGTSVNQDELSMQALNKHPKYVLAKESFSLNEAAYNTEKAKYDDESSKVFQNQWFKKTRLEPAYAKFEAATDKLEAVKAELGGKNIGETLQFWLKVLYRLSAVVFCMLLAKGAVSFGIRSFKIG